MNKKLTLILTTLLLSTSLISCGSKKCNHVIVIDKAVEATCSSFGLTEGSHCSKCGEIINPQAFVDKLPHHYVIDEAVEATCCAEGKTVGFHCDVCGEVFVEQENTPKAQHVKGELISFDVEDAEGIENPGLFECSYCHEHFVDTVGYADLNLPVVTLDGDFTDISKENKKNIVVTYEDGNQSFSYPSTIKFQGNTSLAYSKKNYNIQFFKDETYADKQKVKLVNDWGKESKYTLKANWVDFSQARNLVTANLFGELVRSRELVDNYTNTINGGAVDGYPVVVYKNNEFQGLYTLNTANDKYLYDMNGDETTREATIMCAEWSDYGKLKQPLTTFEQSYFELKYCSTEDTEIGTDWVIDSFNELITFLNDTQYDGSAFKANVSKYTNVDRVIDQMILMFLCHGKDNISKNIMWSTYDGQHWVPSVYDLDGTWGLSWDGKISLPSEVAFVPHEANMLWENIWWYFHDDIVERYENLRSTILSLQNIDKQFVDFAKKIPNVVYEGTASKWEESPSQTESHISQIINWTNASMLTLDTYIGITSPTTAFNKVSFNSQVKCYLTDDYSRKGDIVTETLSRDGVTGYVANDKDGQVNFEVVLPEGYEIDTINVTGDYKNLKGPEDTGRANTYRVTKIASDITIEISFKSI